MLVVWAICMDGPCAGLVLELKTTDRLLQIKTDADGVCQYRRYQMLNPTTRIALFKFTKTLVV